MSKLIGIWTLESSENINEYLKQLGMSLAKRRQQTSLNIQPRLIVSNTDEMWTIAIDMKNKGTETIFYEGKVVDTSNELKFVFDSRFYFDARRTCKSVFKFETPDRLVQKMEFIETQETQIIVREINENDQLVECLDMNEVKAKRVFNRSQ